MGVSDVKVLQGAETGVVVPCFASMVLTCGAAAVKCDGSS